MDATTEKRVVNMRLTNATIEAMHRLAAEHRRSFAGEVEWAMMQYVEQQTALKQGGVIYPTADQIEGIVHIIREGGTRES